MYLSHFIFEQLPIANIDHFLDYQHLFSNPEYVCVQICVFVLPGFTKVSLQKVCKKCDS